MFYPPFEVQMEPGKSGLPKLLAGNSSAEEVFACALLLAIAMFAAYTSKKHRCVYLPESSCALLLGMVAGAVTVALETQFTISFNPQFFFYVLLPVIIFNAGYALKKKEFFRNFVTIVLFAVFGTIASSLVYGLCTYGLYKMNIVTHLTSKSPLLESLMFGTLMSAIDPVATLSILQDVQAPEMLYNLVFGESLVNDASSIVLFRTFEAFMDEEFRLSTITVAITWFIAISLGSIMIGTIVSLCCAFILKHVEIHSEFAKFELGFILLSGYISYALAEALTLSGIMSLFFCGICNAHYSYYNTSHATKVSSHYAFEALSFMAELFTFSYLGMQIVVVDHTFDSALFWSSIPLCLLSRAANILPLSFLANTWRQEKITPQMMTMMWFSGLRGAIAYALAVNMPVRNGAMESTTLFIVFATTLILGGSTAPLLSLLGLTARNQEKVYNDFDVPLVAGKSLHNLLEHDTANGPNTKIRDGMKWLDEYLKPIFGGQKPTESRHKTAMSYQLRQYSGADFLLSVPETWEEYLHPMQEDGVLVHFIQQQKSEERIHPAEVDVVMCTTSSSCIQEEGHLTEFLKEYWHVVTAGIGSRVCEPLDVSTSSKGACVHMPMPPDKGPPGSEVLSSLLQNDKPEQVMASQAAATIPRNRDMEDSPILTHQRSRRVLRSMSYNSRNIPAFILKAQTKVVLGRIYYRYELIVHPDSQGSRTGELERVFLSATEKEGRIFFCRVSGTENFFHQYEEVARHVLDSFTINP